MSSVEQLRNVLEGRDTVHASPDFIAHCINRTGEHLKAAENCDPGNRMFEKHVEMVKAYAAVLKAIR